MEDYQYKEKVLATRINEIFKLVQNNDVTYIPSYKLGGIQITCPEGFTWRFISGLSPYMTTYVDFDKTINEIYDKAGGELEDLAISFEYKIYMLSTSGITLFEGSIPNLFVLERRIERRQGISSLLISDARFYLKNIQYPSRFNLKRKIPRNKVIDELPRKLKDVYSLPTWAYYPETLNNGEPWSAYEIADELLKSYLNYYEGNVEAEDYKGPKPDDQDIIGIQVKDVIEANLLRARMNLGFFPNGKFYIYPVDLIKGGDGEQQQQQQESYSTLFMQYLAMGGLTIDEKEKHINPTSGALFINSLWRQRTSKVNIGFYKEYEILAEFNTNFDTTEQEAAYFAEDTEIVDAHEDGEEIKDAPESHGYPKHPPVFEKQPSKLSLHATMLNVAPAPFLMTIDGKEIAPGTYLPIKKYLEEWNIDEQRILDKWFGHYWTRDILVEEFKTSGVSIDIIMSTREYRAKVNMIMKHWSQTFQIDPNYMKSIESIRAERTMIIDSVTSTKLPPLAWTNYTTFPSIYPPINFCKEYGIDVNELRMGEAITHAPMGESINEVIKNQVSDYTVSIAPGQEKAGIIKISPMTDAHGVNYQLVHRDAIPDTIPPVPKSVDPDCFMNTKLNPEWRLVVLLSATFLVPNNRKQVHWETRKAIDHGMKGNRELAYEKINRSIVARHEIDTDEDDDVILSVTKEPTNKNSLKDVAKSDAEVYFHQLSDRIDGHETYNGIYPIPLFANIGAIAYNFGIDGVTTHISAKQIPPSKDSLDELPKDLRRKLRQWLPS